jgi:hypothetical protein
LIVQKDVGFYRKAKSIKPEDEARHDRRWKKRVWSKDQNIK